MKNTNKTNKEEKTMKNTNKVVKGMKKVCGVLIPVALITGGAFIVKAAMKAAGAKDAADAIDEAVEEITETIEDNFEEVE